MFRARSGWIQFAKRGQLVGGRAFCHTNNKLTTNADHNAYASVRDYEAYRQLDKLDFMTAAKILFTTPPKKKKFGIDFHLVQLFFACMPSLAVYLVAQYARYEIRRMEEELELKKKQTEEEEKEKELESNAAEEIGEGSDPELLKVKVRLDKLEEAVKEIVVESKKQLDSSVAKNQDNGSKLERQPNKTSSQSRSEASNSAAKNLKSEEIAPGSSKGTPTESLPVTDASPHDQKGKI
ncbi:hypothetical protein AAG906_026458 [Vitis piasezkii]